MYKVKGKVIHVGATEQVTEKFKKRDLVIFIDGMYPQEYIFEAHQGRCEMLDNLRLHQEIEVSFAIQGRGWVNAENVKRWANTLVVLSIA